jgi:hypothetical protein
LLYCAVTGKPYIAREDCLPGDTPTARKRLWSCDLVADVPRKEICRRRVLESRTGGHEQMVVFVEVLNRADVKAGSGLAAVRATEHDGSSLVEYLVADG